MDEDPDAVGMARFLLEAGSTSRVVKPADVCNQCQVDFPSEDQFIHGIKGSDTPLEGDTLAPWAKAKSERRKQ
ncbi:hypothetical protein [Streptomyces sp. NPDC090112]|uniref:hypothetical protein n=1 Tax=Streptomyces sp. NPDC090112 TaxID=3365949 RepID=UPI00380AE542